jgi:hypothetical protein
VNKKNTELVGAWIFIAIFCTYIVVSKHLPELDSVEVLGLILLPILAVYALVDFIKRKRKKREHK